MTIDLEAMKAAALAAGGQPWTVDGYIVCEELGTDSEALGRVNVAHMLSSEAAAHIAAANPAAVLALIERIERLTEAQQVNDPALGVIAASAAYHSLSGRHKAALAEIADLRGRLEIADADNANMAALLRKQAKAAIALADNAKHYASLQVEHAKAIAGQSNPEALASERAANAMLTEENERLQRELDAAEERNRIYRRMTGYCVGGEKLTREEYPRLFSAADEAAKNYTGGDFKLPDLKGHFIKGQS